MEQVKSDLVTVAKEGAVLRITLNRPERLNVFNHPMHQALVRALDEACYSEEIRVVVLTGAGRAFSAGGDMSDVAITPAEFATEAEWARRLVLRMVECDKPILCRLNGDAIGLGATIALLCDVVIADERARLGDPHVKMGLVAGDGGALVWPLHAGVMAAKYYLLTGDLLPAQEAKALGLVTFVVPEAELDARTDKVAQKLAEGAPLAIRWTRRAINAALSAAMPAVFEQSLAWEGMSMMSEDHAEAKAAFFARRKPVFQGR